MTKSIWKGGLLLATLASLLVGCQSDENARMAATQPEMKAIEAQANTFTWTLQIDPSLAADADGNVLVTWTSRKQEAGTVGVFAQRFDPLGRRIGTEIHVNQTVAGAQVDPAVAYAANGTAWIAWWASDRDEHGGAIMARPFGITPDGDFGPLGDEIRINEIGIGHQSNVTAAATGDGGIVFAWLSSRPNGSAAKARVFNTDGSPRGGEFAIQAPDAGRVSPLAIAAAGSDRFVATWGQTNEQNRPDTVWARVFDSRGNALTDAIRVPAVDGQMHIEPTVDAAADGRFVVAWLTWQKENYAVAYRLFEADGTPRTAPQQLTADNQWHSGVTTAMAPDGRFAIAYNVEYLGQTSADDDKPSHRPTSSEIRAQRFAADGAPLGENFRVNVYDVGRQALSIAASGRLALWTARDQLALVWTGKTAEGDKNGIGLSLLAPADLDVPAPIEVPQVAAAQDLGGDEVHALIPPLINPDFVESELEPLFASDGPDFGFIADQANGGIPPDPDVAVGPEHLVTVVNSRIRFFEHDGTQRFSQSISGSNGFFGSAGAFNTVFDPVAAYDTFADRFVVAADELWNNRNSSAINFAVSDDFNPLGTWHKYRFNISSFGGFFDFPNLGIGTNAYYVVGDFFYSPTGNWVFIIPKVDVLNGDPTSVTGVQLNNGFQSTGAVKTFDADAPAQYFLTSYSGYSDRLKLIAITNPLSGSPDVDTYLLSVPSFSQPPNASQLGSSNTVDTIDQRIKNGVFRNGSLWACHTIGQSSTARVRWYEIEMNGWPTSGQNPTLRQSGTLNYGTGVHTFMADINVDDFGNAIIAFNQSSSSDYVSVRRTFRFATDPLGTMQTPVLLKESTASVVADRFGDYSGVDEEPDAPGTFWSHLEYVSNSDYWDWRTWAARTILVPPDCNDNGIPDADDISSGTSEDCNGNGIPDECDIADGTTPDCNGNGVPDSCDIAAGTSQDCNGNGIPDECDIAAGTSDDCNLNGIPDECDLLFGAASDCNGNGILDDCDIVAATSPDCNGNGRPDECDVANQPPIVVSSEPAVNGWIEISATGTQMVLSGNGIDNATMPFVNDYVASSSVRIANDGSISFGGTLILPSENEEIPTANAFGGDQAIFAMWDDLSWQTGGVYYETTGTAPNRTFIVEWKDRPHAPGNYSLEGDEVTFQIQVFETPVNNVFAQMLYQDTLFLNGAYDNGASATIGYQRDDQYGSQWGFNQAGVISAGTVLSVQAQPPLSSDTNEDGIPDECQGGLPGDMNCDGTVDVFDINPFVTAVLDPAEYATAYPACNISNGDINGDSNVDVFDINPFVDLVLGN